MKTMLTASLAALSLGLGAAGVAYAADKDLAIAVAGPMTGPVASIGEQMKRGAQAAADAINEAGGVDGRKIRIVVEDDACDPKQAVAVANHIRQRADQVRRWSRLLRLVDPGFRGLCRQ